MLGLDSVVMEEFGFHLVSQLREVGLYDVVIDCDFVILVVHVG